jgi:prepilin-type N-terminal cleavage/methylation domain-containing protein/prepilin-type processing-associated H-X9-DG protein
MRHALTLTELLVTLSIVAVLAGILLPVLFHAREKGRQVICLSHLRQIAAATLLYAHEWDERLPMNAYQATDGQGQPCLVTLVGVLKAFGVSPLTSCPTQPQAFRLAAFLRAKGLAGGECDAPSKGGSFALNEAVFVRGDVPSFGWQALPPVALSQLALPTMTVGVYDGNVAGEARCGFQPFEAVLQGRHLGTANLGFLDGHAKAQPTFEARCELRNINDLPMTENCASGENPYRRRCGETQKVPCVHHFVGLPRQDSWGECVALP